MKSEIDERNSLNQTSATTSPELPISKNQLSLHRVIIGLLVLLNGVGNLLVPHWFMGGRHEYLA